MGQVRMMELAALRAFLEDCPPPAPSGLTPSSGDESNLPYEYELDDLFHLYSTVRRTSCVSVLEFGSGWSTVVLALALHENEESFGEEHRRLVRHPNPFQILTIDASGHWQEVALSRLPAWLKSTVRGVSCNVNLVDRYGSYVHLYDRVPDFVADLIYLDGPDPEQVHGAINGFAYSELHTLPMGADILRIEPHLWPETMIITDGRTANARFLAAHLRRNWQVIHDPFGDRTTFRLEETPFGPVIEEHLSTRLATARALRDKEAPNS